MTTRLFPSYWQRRPMEAPTLGDNSCFLHDHSSAKNLHPSKILKLVLGYRNPTEFVCITDNSDSLLLWKASVIASVRITQVYFKHRQDNKNKCCSNKEKSYNLNYKIENILTKEKHIKKIQIIDLTFVLHLLLSLSVIGVARMFQTWSYFQMFLTYYLFLFSASLVC